LSLIFILYANEKKKKKRGLKRNTRLFVSHQLTVHVLVLPEILHHLRVKNNNYYYY